MSQSIKDLLKYTNDDVNQRIRALMHIVIKEYNLSSYSGMIASIAETEKISKFKGKEALYDIKEVEEILTNVQNKLIAFAESITGEE